MAKTKTRVRCRWCGKDLDDPKHRYSESYCYIRNEKTIRSRVRPRAKTVGDAYAGGKLRPEYMFTDMEDILLKRQQQRGLDAVLGLGANGYRVPRNVSYILEQGFVWTQVVNQRPWAVYVFTPKGKRRKRCNNLYDAVEFHKRITLAGLKGGIVSLGVGYDLPAEWRLKKDKLPRKFKWCPHCAEFRVYKRVDPPVRFEASIKVWNGEKEIYEWKDRLIWLTECQVCGNNNRSLQFRRANQPWELRRIKRGVTRVRARPGAPHHENKRQVRRKR